MIRFNRTTLLLICGAMVGGIVPLTAANASVKSLETKDGLIYDAQAFANGMYIYDGQKTDDSEDDKVNRLDNKFRHKVLS